MAANPRKPYGLMDLKKPLKSGSQVIVYRMTADDYFVYLDQDDDFDRAEKLFPLILEPAKSGTATGETITGIDALDMDASDVNAVFEAIAEMIGFEEAEEFKPADTVYELAYPVEQGELTVLALDFKPKSFAATKKYRREKTARGRLVAFITTMATVVGNEDAPLGSLLIKQLDPYDLTRIMFGFLARAGLQERSGRLKRF